MKHGIAITSLLGITIAASFAVAQVKSAPQCPSDVQVEVGVAAPKGWSASKIASRLVLQEAHVDGSTVRCRYGSLAKSPVELTAPVPPGMTCSVGEDGKTLKCRNVIGPLAGAN